MLSRRGKTRPATALAPRATNSGGLGNDAITVDFAGGGFDMLGGTQRLRVDGGAGNDPVSVALENVATGTARHDISVGGGNHRDTITFSQSTSGGGNVWVGGAALVDGSFGTPDTCAVTSSGPARRRNCEL